VLAQVQRLRQDNPTGVERKGTVFGIGYLYFLSKRTTLYANYGQVSNNSTASFGMLSSDTTVAAGAAGADPKALAFGVRHSF
jgi:predicted porin